jgi:amidase
MNGPRFAAAATALLLAACSTLPAERQPVSQPVAEAGTAPPPAYGGPAEQAAAEAVERIRRLDPQLGSVIAIDPTWQEQARRVDAAGIRGPLAGKPVLIKDNIESIGPLPTTAGSLALAGNVTNRDSPLVARLRAAGAVIVGKTNLSEWANIRSSDSISGWSAVGGQTRNPHALDRNTCGSSSGSGAAVAAGLVSLAVGTETDGSVTCPAAMTGVVGLKPTLGLVPRTHIIPISESQDTPGPMTATVAEAAAMLTAMAGTDSADPATREADRRKADYLAGLSGDALRGKRIGVLRFATGFGTNEPFNRSLETLKAAGAELVEIKEFKAQNFGNAEFQVLLTEFKAGLNAYLQSSPAPLPVRTLADVIRFNQANAAREMPLFGQDIFETAEKTKGLDDPEYRKARADSLRMAGAEGIDRLLKQHKVDALVAPTRSAAWKIDAVHGDVSPGGNGIGSMAAVAGYPHLTVPMGQVKGLPVGISFFGPKWSDGLLLQLGHAFELARGPLPAARFLRSVEEAPEVAPALGRQLQPGN